MGCCPRKQHEAFSVTAPLLEEALIDDGIVLVTYWLSLPDTEQRRRFQARVDKPAKRGKPSRMDLEAQARWVDHAEAKDRCSASATRRSAPGESSTRTTRRPPGSP